MSEFNNVTIDKKANYYFDGNVTSRTIIFTDGSKKTLGIMLPGEYQFNTNQKEIIEITSGKVEVLISDQEDWISMHEGMKFEVPKDSIFKLKVKTIFDYCCSYLDD